MGSYIRPCYTWMWEGPAKAGVRLLCSRALPLPSPHPSPLPSPVPTLPQPQLCYLPQALTDVLLGPPTSVAQAPA